MKYQPEASRFVSWKLPSGGRVSACDCAEGEVSVHSVRIPWRGQQEQPLGLSLYAALAWG